MLLKLCRLFHCLEGGMKPQNLHPMIIGGSMAGPALSLLPKKAAVRATGSATHPYRGEDGVADLIASNGALVSEFCFRDRRGKVLARYRAGNVEKYRWPSVAISRT